MKNLNKRPAICEPSCSMLEAGSPMLAGLNALIKQATIKQTHVHTYTHMRARTHTRTQQTNKQNAREHYGFSNHVSLDISFAGHREHATSLSYRHCSRKLHDNTKLRGNFFFVCFLFHQAICVAPRLQATNSPPFVPFLTTVFSFPRDSPAAFISVVEHL